MISGDSWGGDEEGGRGEEGNIKLKQSSEGGESNNGHHYVIFFLAQK